MMSSEAMQLGMRPSCLGLSLELQLRKTLLLHVLDHDIHLRLLLLSSSLRFLFMCPSRLCEGAFKIRVLAVVSCRRGSCSYTRRKLWWLGCRQLLCDRMIIIWLGDVIKGCFFLLYTLRFRNASFDGALVRLLFLLTGKLCSL